MVESLIPNSELCALCRNGRAKAAVAVALDRVNGMNTTFEPLHVQLTLRKVDLIPAQVDSFCDTQAVASHEKH
jgi:hypothetical protein